VSHKKEASLVFDITSPSVIEIVLADRTARSNMISYWHDDVVRLSVCDAVHCG